jgi:hypothetical protein
MVQVCYRLNARSEAGASAAMTKIRNRLAGARARALNKLGGLQESGGGQYNKCRHARPWAEQRLGKLRRLLEESSFLLAVSIRATFRAILWLMEKRAVPIAKPNIAVHKCDPPGRELRHVE